MQRNRAASTRDGGGARRRIEIETIARALHGVTRHVGRFQRTAEQRWRVSSAQLLVLRLLAQAPSPSVNDLAALTDTHQSTVSVVVARLVRRGLVRRRRAVDDSRRTELALTPAGWALHRDARTAELRHLAAALAALPGEQVRSIAAALDLVGGTLGAANGIDVLRSAGGASRRAPLR